MKFDEYHKEVKDNAGGSDWYKYKEGDNKIRIMSDFLKTQGIQRGKMTAGYITDKNRPQGDDKVTTKFWAWAIVRGKTPEEDEFKIVSFGQGLVEQLGAYRHSPDYKFESFPMPYDINIRADKAGTIDVTYTMIPARANTEVTEAELGILLKKKTIETIYSQILHKQDEKTSGVPTGTNTNTVEAPEKIAYPEGENPSDIPF